MMHTFKPFIVALAASVAIFVCLYAILVYPASRERIQEQTRATEINAKLTEYSSSVVTIESIASARDSLRNVSEILNERLYARADVMALVERLSSLCQDANITLRELSPSVNQLLAMNAVQPSSTEPQFLELSLRVTGGIKDVAQWMQTLTKEPFFILTNSIHAFSREQGVIPAEYVINFTAALGALPVGEVATK